MLLAAQSAVLQTIAFTVAPPALGTFSPSRTKFCAPRFSDVNDVAEGAADVPVTEESAAEEPVAEISTSDEAAVEEESTEETTSETEPVQVEKERFAMFVGNLPFGKWKVGATHCLLISCSV